MPIYDYRCDHCGHAFSAVRGFDDPVIGVCPSCGKTPRRLIGPPAIVFKGSGWYKTDSRKGPKDEGGGKPAETKPAASGEAKPAETKTAASGEAKPAADTSKKSEAAS